MCAVLSLCFRLKSAGLFLFAAPKRKQKGAVRLLRFWTLSHRATRRIRASTVALIRFANPAHVSAFRFDYVRIFAHRLWRLWAQSQRVTRCIRTSSVTLIRFANFVFVPVLQFGLIRICLPAFGNFGHLPQRSPQRGAFQTNSLFQ